jgi:glycosyltransferase involved in cell wall biosynthesis
MTESESVNRKRHCMVVHAHYPYAETRVERQAQALLANGIEVDVICLGGSSQPAQATIDGVQVYRLPVQRNKGVSFVVQLFEYLAFFVLAFICLSKLHLRWHYSVVQVHNLPDFLVFVALIPKLTGASIILDLHDLMPEFYAERIQRSMNSLPVRLLRWQEYLSCRFANHVITVTELWRQSLIERGQPADRVSVVMNLADDRVFNRDTVAAMSTDNDCNSVQCEAADGRFRLIYHGVMDYRHGLDLALEAINLVRQSAPEVHSTLHGGGPYRKTLVSLVDEFGLQENVQFSNRLVPTVELPKLIREADLAIVPYRNGVFTGEILPTKLMEYAALGIPSIAARTPAIATYFDETMIEFFTPGSVDDLAGCILKLYADRTLLTKLAEGAEKFNRRYNWARVSAEYVALVDRLGAR